jgi:hypothetical protein
VPIKIDWLQAKNPGGDGICAVVEDARNTQMSANQHALG